MRHDMESCDQGGEDQDEAWLDGPIARVKSKSKALKRGTGFSAFEKFKCIFSITLVGSLEKSRKWTLVLVAPDAGPARLVHCQLLAQA